MAFSPWVGRMWRFPTIWSRFKNWMCSWGSSMSRLIRRPHVDDEETPIGEQSNTDKGYSYIRDAEGEFISGGITGIVELLDDGTVLKAPFPDSDIQSHIEDIAKEADIYHRIGPHRRFVRLLGHSSNGLVLEYMKNGDLKSYLQAHDSIPTRLKLKWAYQVAEAVDLLHKNEVIHCDIKPRNLLLVPNFDIQIIDFPGSLLNGSKPASAEGTRFYLPRHWRDRPTVTTDLFALGSTLYEIFQGTSPYDEIPSDEVERLFTQKEFPDVSGILFGEIIKQCWLSQVDSAAHVQNAIQDILSRTANADCTPHLGGLGLCQDVLTDQVVSP